MSTTWSVYLVGRGYPNMKTRKVKQSNLHKSSMTVFFFNLATLFGVGFLSVVYLAVANLAQLGIEVHY